IRDFSGSSPMWAGLGGPMIRGMDNDLHTSTTTASATPPGDPEPPPYRRLYRKTDRAVLAGVAAGLGDHFSVDPLVFRVGFVISAFVGGTGIFAYLLLWWLV